MKVLGSRWEPDHFQLFLIFDGLTQATDLQHPPPPLMSCVLTVNELITSGQKQH